MGNRVFGTHREAGGAVGKRGPASRRRRADFGETALMDGQGEKHNNINYLNFG